MLKLIIFQIHITLNKFILWCLRRRLWWWNATCWILIRVITRFLGLIVLCRITFNWLARTNFAITATSTCRLLWSMVMLLAHTRLHRCEWILRAQKHFCSWWFWHCYCSLEFWFLTFLIWLFIVTTNSRFCTLCVVLNLLLLCLLICLCLFTRCRFISHYRRSAQIKSVTE